MDGLQLLNKVKKLNPNVRTMLISAYEFQNNPIFEKYLNEGTVNTFMEKPIKIDRLCQRVREEFRVYQLISNKLVYQSALNHFIDRKSVV